MNAIAVTRWYSFHCRCSALRPPRRAEGRLRFNERAIIERFFASFGRVVERLISRRWLVVGCQWSSQALMIPMYVRV
jgi:hypothetical protein